MLRGQFLKKYNKICWHIYIYKTFQISINKSRIKGYDPTYWWQILLYFFLKLSLLGNSTLFVDFNSLLNFKFKYIFVQLWIYFIIFEFDSQEGIFKQGERNIFGMVYYLSPSQLIFFPHIQFSSAGGEAGNRDQWYSVIQSR